MKFDEVFNSSKENVNKTPTTSGHSSTSTNNASLSSPSILSLQVATNSGEPSSETIANSDDKLSQLIGQVKIETTKNNETSQFQSAHSLLESLMKAPDRTGNQFSNSYINALYQNQNVSPYNQPYVPMTNNTEVDQLHDNVKSANSKGNSELPIDGNSSSDLYDSFNYGHPGIMPFSSQSPFSRFPSPFGSMAPFPSYPLPGYSMVPGVQPPMVPLFPGSAMYPNPGQACPPGYPYYAYQNMMNYYQQLCYNSSINMNRENPELHGNFHQELAQSGSKDLSPSLLEKKVPDTVEPKKSIRVDVNDLFSLSKAFAANYANANPNSTLNNIIQEGQGTVNDASGNDLNVSETRNKKERQLNRDKSNAKHNYVSIESAANSKNEIGQNQISSRKKKKGFVKLTHLSENFALDTMKLFRKELLTDFFTRRLMNDKRMNYIYTIIIQYFEYIDERLKQEDLNYLNFIDSYQYAYDDFFSYGSRFWEFIKKTMMFQPELFEYYLSLERKYQQLLPNGILQMRNILNEIKLDLTKKEEENNINVQQLKEETYKGPIKMEMVTYKKVDSRKLHQLICSITEVKVQIEKFIDNVQLSDEGEKNRNAFIDCLECALRESELSQFGPKLFKFGSLTNGLGTYDSDLDIVIKFNSVPVDILDYSTCMLALEVIQMILQNKFNIRNKDMIVPSKRCPIIKLKFNTCFPSMKNEIVQQQKNSGFNQTNLIEFNNCDISLITTYGVHNSKFLHFLTQYDRRFYELALILKYWAKKNELIDTTMFSTYAFTMLIIFFLQNQNPPVLPPINKLQSLAKIQPNKAPVKLHKYSFEFCDDIDMIGKSNNIQSTQELLIEFFRFYATFDFFNFAISPRTGTPIKKINLRQEKIETQCENFNIISYICIEDPFVLEHNVGYTFRGRNIKRWNDLLRFVACKATPKNCIKLITDPSNFSHNRLVSNLIALPFNLFCHEVKILYKNDIPYHHKMLLHTKPKIMLQEINHMPMTITSLSTMMELYFIVIRHLLIEYLRIPPINSAIIFQVNEDKLKCSIDFGYLSHINYRLNLRSQHEYGLLFAYSGKRNSDYAKRFKLLKKLRDQLCQQSNPLNLRDRKVQPNGVVEEWFKIDLVQSSTLPSSTQILPKSLLNSFANGSQLPIPGFIFRQIVPTNSNSWSIANKFSQLVHEIIYNFNYTIDRSNSICMFNSLIEEFFS